MANDGSRTINVEALEKSIEGKRRTDSPLSAKCCIFKVPQVLRRHKPQAYQPDVVSIGPFHHRSRKKFGHMENVKHWYLNKLLSRLNISVNELIQRIGDVDEFGTEARGFYAEPLKDLNQKAFIEMMILDGCFLLELFFRASACYKNSNSQVEQPDNTVEEEYAGILFQGLDIDNDSIFNMGCMIQYLCHDLLLLENQLPWVVLKRLYSLTIGRGKPDPETALTRLVLHFFSILSELTQHCNRNFSCTSDKKILHILDLIRRSIVDPFKELKSIEKAETNLPHATLLSDAGVEFSCTSNTKFLHILDVIRRSIVGPCKEFKSDEKSDQTNFPHATLLSDAGVEFKKGSDDGSIMNINFKKGELTIPYLEIAEMTEPLFRNLIAFEQCYHGCEHLITSYARLMDNLIASKKDVDLLCKKEILGNWLSAIDAFNFFENLYTDTCVVDFYYGGLCDELNKYHKLRRHKWRARLKRDYCSNPWKIISLVAAFILLGLTLLQTAYTIQQYYFPPQ